MLHPENRVVLYVIWGLVLAGVFYLRFRRMSRARPLKLERLWILPAGLVVIAGLTLASAPPKPADWPWLVLAAAVGAGLGWLRGRLMTIMVDPTTHALNVRASPAALAFLIALLMVRMALRSTLSTSVGAVLAADALILLAVALLSAQSLEMAVRARRLLREAKGAAG